MNSKTLSQLVIKGMMEKKASDIVLIDLKSLPNSVADYFVICSGSSDTQVEAIAESVAEETEKQGNKPWQKEGMKNNEWVLLDYVDVVVHIFTKRSREFYGIEHLWADAVIERIETEV